MAKFIIVSLATLAAFFLLPVFFPSLDGLVMGNLHGITWRHAVSVGVLLWGTTSLSSK